VAAALGQIVQALRRRCKQARIIVRGDSGLCVDELMGWCEAHRVHYCLGLARNRGLIEQIQGALAQARARCGLPGGAATRVFREFAYATVRQSWSLSRRVIAKAEVSALGDNPRFIVTHLPGEGFQDDDDQTRFTPQRLYEEVSCARGEMENVLKQQTLDLTADRMSSHPLASNQLRLWLATLA
jgi:hypothetical protein